MLIIWCKWAEWQDSPPGFQQLELSLCCKQRSVIHVMSHHPSTPTRVARYVPPPQYSVGQVAGMESQQQLLPTYGAPLSPNSSLYSHGGHATHSHAYSSPEPSFMRSPKVFSAAESGPFGSGASWTFPSHFSINFQSIMWILNLNSD